jgi:hypothetical protein
MNQRHTIRRQGWSQYVVCRYSLTKSQAHNHGTTTTTTSVYNILDRTGLTTWVTGIVRHAQTERSNAVFKDRLKLPPEGTKSTTSPR